MSLKYILMAAVATAAFPSLALANDYYRCNDSLCHDDQADETRRLNLMQLEDPGAGLNAVPSPDDTSGQGGPYYESPDKADSDGQPPDTDDDPNGDNYGPSSDDDDRSDEPYDDQDDEQADGRDP